MKIAWNGDFTRKKAQERDSIMDDIYAIFAQGEINLNLGCGKMKLDNVINCDLYDPEADKKLDAKDLSEFTDGSVNAIYASQLLEHFTYDESIRLMKEWHRALKEGGHIIIGVPDMEEILEVASTWDLRQEAVWTAMMKYIYGWQTNEGDIHKWGYCAESLMAFVKKMGFKMRRIYRGYPRRPSPTMMVIAQKNKEE